MRTSLRAAVADARFRAWMRWIETKDVVKRPGRFLRDSARAMENGCARVAEGNLANEFDLERRAKLELIEWIKNNPAVLLQMGATALVALGLYLARGASEAS